MKRWFFDFSNRKVEVTAEEEGDCRFMVRLSIDGCFDRVRIGYLTGSKQSWVGEVSNSNSVVRGRSAKSVCEQLAQKALARLWL